MPRNPKKRAAAKLKANIMTPNRKKHDKELHNSLQSITKPLLSRLDSHNVWKDGKTTKALWSAVQLLTLSTLPDDHNDAYKQVLEFLTYTVSQWGAFKPGKQPSNSDLAMIADDLARRAFDTYNHRSKRAQINDSETAYLLEMFTWELTSHVVQSARNLGDATVVQTWAWKRQDMARQHFAGIAKDQDNTNQRVQRTNTNPEQYQVMDMTRQENAPAPREVVSQPGGIKREPENTVSLAPLESEMDWLRIQQSQPFAGSGMNPGRATAMATLPEEHDGNGPTGSASRGGRKRVRRPRRLVASTLTGSVPSSYRAAEPVERAISSTAPAGSVSRPAVSLGESPSYGAAVAVQTFGSVTQRRSTITFGVCNSPFPCPLFGGSTQSTFSRYREAPEKSADDSDA